ncbi:MAG TPA: hypothetical protein VGG83_10855 [Trebonia sp.]
MAEPELCGDLEGDPYEGLTVECDLPKGHDGDHHAVVTWPQYVPPPPRDPDAEPRHGLFYKPEIWGKALEQALVARMVEAAPIVTGALRDSAAFEVTVTEAELATALDDSGRPATKTRFLDEPKYLTDTRLQFQGVNGPTKQ